MIGNIETIRKDLNNLWSSSQEETDSGESTDDVGSSRIPFEFTISNVSEFPVSFVELKLHVRGAIVTKDGFIQFNDDDPGVREVSSHEFYEPLRFDADPSDRVDASVVEAYDGFTLGRRGVLEVKPGKTIRILTTIRKSLVRNIYLTTAKARRLAPSELQGVDAARLIGYVNDHGGNIDLAAKYINSKDGRASSISINLYKRL